MIEPIDDGQFDEPYMWLGREAEEVAALVHTQMQREIEAAIGLPVISEPDHDE